MVSQARRRALPRGYEWAACDLCGADNARVVLDGARDMARGGDETFSIVRCGSCGLRYVNPRPDVRTMSRYYSAEYLPHNPESFPAAGGRAKAWLRSASKLPYRLRFGEMPLVEPPPFRGAALLDVGCGVGGYLAEAQRLGWDVHGVEPDAVAAERAREATGDGSRITVGTAEDVRLEPEGYDCITMWHVLEHVHSPSRALAAAVAALRPGGVLKVAVPNAEGFEAALFGKRWGALDVPRHLYHFSVATLVRYLREVGFDAPEMAPQWFPSSISDSVDYVIEDVTGRPWRRPKQWITYYATTPIASVSYVLGNTGVLIATARKPGASEQRRAA
jgi:2-polyprenyl-3-methyl-5-hydroxy-6-metoxy-1,4-benzoquinol methylase